MTHHRFDPIENLKTQAELAELVIGSELSDIENWPFNKKEDIEEFYSVAHLLAQAVIEYNAYLFGK